MTPVTINGRRQDINLPGDTPLLWALRDGWGSPAPSSVAAWRCAAPAPCTLTVRPSGHVSRRSRRWRQEGHHHRGHRGGPGRQGRADGLDRVNVPQCGYCQPGQIMSATALLKPTPSRPMPTSTAHDREHLPLWHLPAHPDRRSSTPPACGTRSSARSTLRRSRPPPSVTIASVSRRAFLRAVRPGQPCAGRRLSDDGPRR